MSFRNKLMATVTGGIAVAVCVAGLSLAIPSLAHAQTGTPAAGSQATTPQTNGNQAVPGGRANVGRDQYLAQALGITQADLQAAQVKARNAAIDAAVKAGKITQSQADALKNGQRGLRLDLGISATDQEKMLADALNITVDKLQTAEQTAFKAELAQAVTDGRITQAQADLQTAEQALHKYIADKGLFASAVQSAVKDGVLTQAQADAILQQANSGLGGHGFGGFGGPDGFGGGRGGRGGHGGPGGFGGMSGAPAAPGTNGTGTAPTL